MGKNTTARVADVVGLLHRLYPPALADDWDNVGLQLGDPAAAVTRVLVCLDPDTAALEQAVQRGAEVVVSHHPLIFRPLKQITAGDATGRVLLAAAQQGVAVLSAHTNLDRGEDGLNDWLARHCGLETVQPLCPGDGPGLVKLVVFVPAEHAEAVAEAIFAAGAGQIGRYDCCAFQVEGEGSFRPLAGTDPFLGSEGTLERVREIRLETILRQDLVKRVVARMTKAHPYEEVAYDLYPLQNRQQSLGMGRIGRLPVPVTLTTFAATLGQQLQTTALRVVGDPERSVAKVALCSGSGASLISDALRQGADVLVTGDVKYHDARRAQEEGLALIDAGHFATERIAVPALAERLRSAAAQRGLELDFLEEEGDEDPFWRI